MIVAIAPVTLLGIVFFVLFHGMLFRPRIHEDTAAWLEAFSLDAYAPMQRLLDEEDFVFLESQPGYRRSIGRALRRERKAIYQQYLSRLAGDFQQLFAIAKLMIVYSSEDRSEFAASLWKQQMTFHLALNMVHLRLAFYPYVNTGWTLDGLLRPVQVLQRSIDRIQAA